MSRDGWPLLVNVKEVARLTGVRPVTVWARISAGRFPLPLVIGGSRRWRRRDVEAWKRARGITSVYPEMRPPLRSVAVEAVDD